MSMIRDEYEGDGVHLLSDPVSTYGLKNQWGKVFILPSRETAELELVSLLMDGEFWTLMVLEDGVWRTVT